MAILRPGAPQVDAAIVERRVADRRTLNRRAEDRRTSLRRPLDTIPLIAEVRLQSQRVDVINVSAGGLLIVGSQRLRPGLRSQLDIVLGNGPMRVTCRVIRSEVAQLSRVEIQYRSAVAFEQRLDFLDEQLVERAAEPAAVGDLAGVVIYSGVVDPELEEHLVLNGW